MRNNKALRSLLRSQRGDILLRTCGGALSLGCGGYIASKWIPAETGVGEQAAGVTASYAVTPDTRTQREAFAN